MAHVGPAMTFRDFYPHYLELHANPWCRRTHVLGVFAELPLLIIAAFTQLWWLLALAPPVIYGFAWAGHFLFAHNHPATFEHPLWSMLGFWRMMAEITTGKIAL